MFKILLIDEDADSNRKFKDITRDKSLYELTIVATVDEAKKLIAPDNDEGSATAASSATSPVQPSVESPAAAEATSSAASLVPQLIFIDISKITGEPAEWFIAFKAALAAGGSENVPIILLSSSNDPVFIRKFLGPDVQDIFVKPVLSTILQASINYFLNDRKELAREITPLKSTAEMYFQAEAKEISEFEMKISTPKQIAINDFKPIYADFFKTSPEHRVIARCTDCQTDEETEGLFIETFSFVGVPPAITQEIRVWLKSQYVNQKLSGKK